MFKSVLFLCLFLSFKLTYAFDDYDENDFKSDWSAPFSNEQSRQVMWWGGGITALLVAQREQWVDRLQDDIATDKPLGDSSAFFDLMGRMVPNLAYMGYQWKFGEEEHKNRRLAYMFKASFFSGMTTFFLKRAVNEQRPNKGDRNAFPSGHTTTAFAFSTVVALEHPDWAIPAHTLAVLVGLSRMNDNVHYLHDVTMGATIGMAYGYAFYKANPYEDFCNLMILPLNKGMSLSFQALF